MGKSFKQRTNKDIVTLNDAVDEIDLIDIYRTFQPKEANLRCF